MKVSNTFYIIFFILILCNCNDTAENNLDKIKADLNLLSKRIVPDKRVEIIDIEVIENKAKISITAKSDKKAVLDSLRAFVSTLTITPDTTFNLLPDNNVLENKVFATVKISVANIRSQPKHSAELATQATLGTPLKVLEKKENWYRVQTPDKYISWVDAGGIELQTKQSNEAWLDKPKIIITKPISSIFKTENSNSQVVSDLTGGNILALLSQNNTHFEVELPDGRKGFVDKKSADVYQEWLASLDASPANLTKVSKQMMGIPYLWGGTSFKGVDCSGFTKTIYFMNGMVIPRDASQQVHAGKPIDTSTGFNKLQPGDLLFFGRKATKEQSEKVVHVAMWLGNNEFIHASGRVRVNSFDPKASHYNEYELNRFLRAKRYLNAPQELLLPLQNTKLYYSEKI